MENKQQCILKAQNIKITASCLRKSTTTKLTEEHMVPEEGRNCPLVLHWSLYGQDGLMGAQAVEGA